MNISSWTKAETRGSSHYEARVDLGVKDSKGQAMGYLLVVSTSFGADSAAFVGRIMITKNGEVQKNKNIYCSYENAFTSLKDAQTGLEKKVRASGAKIQRSAEKNGGIFIRKAGVPSNQTASL